MQKGNIKANTVFNIIKSACTIVFPLITFPYISRTLLADGVGKITFSSSIVSYFSLLATLGISIYAIRECSQNRGDRESLSKVSSEIFSINIITTIVAYIALAITLIFWKKVDAYRELIVILSSAILFGTIGADWINSAMEDYKFITIRTLSFQVLSIVLMFIFIHNPEDYLKYALISVLASSGANIVNVFYRKKYCDIYFTFKMNAKKHLPPILLLFSMIIAQQIYVNSDITILGIYRGDYEVGLYSTSVKIYNIVNTIIASVSIVVWPQIAEAYKKKKQSEINRLAKYSLGFIITFGLPAIVGLNVVTEEIILLLAGKEYLGAVTSMHILTIALFFSFVGGWIGSTNFLPNGRERVCLISSCVAAVVNIVLNLILIPKWGLNAAAFTTAISEILALIVLICNYDRNQEIKGLFELIWKPVVGCIVIILTSIVAKVLISDCMLVFVVVVLCSVFLYVLTLVLLKDKFFMDYVGPFIKKIKQGKLK